MNYGKLAMLHRIAGFKFESADFLGDGKADPAGVVELKKFSVALLRFVPEKK